MVEWVVTLIKEPVCFCYPKVDEGFSLVILFQFHISAVCKSYWATDWHVWDSIEVALPCKEYHMELSRNGRQVETIPYVQCRTTMLKLHNRIFGVLLDVTCFLDHVLFMLNWFQTLWLNEEAHFCFDEMACDAHKIDDRWFVQGSIHSSCRRSILFPSDRRWIPMLVMS